mmetsp:Transcript_119501/g.333401  ORF Transcript_119501/g.333401 Transcript_119501/m.333401 type:complete len:82 (-) Transcript_119501:34-279(-)
MGAAACIAMGAATTVPGATEYDAWITGAAAEGITTGDETIAGAPAITVAPAARGASDGISTAAADITLLRPRRARTVRPQS